MTSLPCPGHQVGPGSEIRLRRTQLPDDTLDPAAVAATRPQCRRGAATVSAASVPGKPAGVPGAGLCKFRTGA
jgi:hypothetical protein